MTDTEIKSLKERLRYFSEWPNEMVPVRQELLRELLDLADQVALEKATKKPFYLQVWNEILYLERDTPERIILGPDLYAELFLDLLEVCLTEEQRKAMKFPPSGFCYRGLPVEATLNRGEFRIDTRRARELREGVERQRVLAEERFGAR